jgi:Ulp1 family protease
METVCGYSELINSISNLKDLRCWINESFTDDGTMVDGNFITVEHLIRLAWNQLLDDAIVNRSLHLLIKDSVTFCAVSSLVMQKLEDDTTTKEQWERLVSKTGLKQDLLERRTLLVPWNRGGTHWCLFVVPSEKNEPILYMDGLYHDDLKHETAIRKLVTLLRPFGCEHVS